MTSNATTVSNNEPAYQSALQHLQKGDWEAGLGELRALAERFPYDYELRELVDETSVRAQIDLNEAEDKRRAWGRRLINWAVYALALVVLVAGIDWTVRSYTVAINQQMEAARLAVAQQAQVLQLATQYADAQALLRGGRASEAKVILEAILETDPTYPGARVLLNQVNLLNTLDAQYTEAFQLVQQQAWAAAAVKLGDIAAVDPNYKDVTLLLAEAERQLLLSELIVEADTFFGESNWVEAASAYEGIRAVDPLYDQVKIEERLFECYVKAARAALVNQADSLEALRTAEAYFRKALALRPQDPEIKLERELARLYLLGQASFEEGRLNDVITNLELVYGTDPQYANGSARQMLYEAFAARANAALDSNEYEAAIADFKTALALAEQDETVVLRLYEAYMRLGDAEAAQKNYEAAVLYYRTAVEVGDLKTRALENETMAQALQAAEAAVAAANFSLAYEHYQGALKVADGTQATITHVVQPGEYLVLIATRYHSTVQAIVLANNIANPRLIHPGLELVIPVSP